MLEFRILGPLEVDGSDGPIQLGGPKQRATLAILLLNANRIVSIDRLADELYAGRAPVTAATQVHRQISELRKALGREGGLETRSPGYVLHVGPEQLDLKLFERRSEDARRALIAGDPATALERQRAALDLWRGPAFGDLHHEPFAEAAVGRLNEILLAALEQRVDAELALGHHREIVAELAELAAQHPLHEPFAARLMLALYRSGRQAEALDVYRRARGQLVEEFGIEPGRELRELERAILNQAPSVDIPEDAIIPRVVAAPDRTVLVVSSDEGAVDALLAVAGQLARLAGCSLLIARLLADEAVLPSAAAALNAHRATLAVDARTAAFTTRDRVADTMRLATAYDVRLVLLEPPDLDADTFPVSLASLLVRSPADIGLLSGPEIDWDFGDGVYVPFGGSDHDWAALELGASLAASRGAALRLIGVRGDVRSGRRDASRLLADASLAVQRTIGAEAVPQLVDPSPAELVDAMAGSTVVATGVPMGWRREGLGDARRAILRGGRPTLLVHSGLRPSGLAPAESRTRYTWTIDRASS